MISPRLVMIGVACLAALALVGYLYSSVREDGAQAERARVEAQDDAAREAGRGAAFDWDSCDAAGGTWDVRTGECQ